MSLKQISELQLEMLEVVIERNKEGNPITIEEFYNRFNNHIDYEDEYNDMYHDYIIPDFNMPNGITQHLLPTLNGDELYIRELERYNKLKQKEISDSHKENLEMTKLSQEVILIKNQISDYGKIRGEAERAICYSKWSLIITAIAVVIAMIAVAKDLNMF